RADLRGRGRDVPGREAACGQREEGHGILRNEGLLVPLDASLRRRLGARGGRVRIPRSVVLVGCVARAEVWAACVEGDRRWPGKGRYIGGATRELGRRLQRGRRPHATSRVRVLLRL